MQAQATHTEMGIWDTAWQPWTRMVRCKSESRVVCIGVLNKSPGARGLEARGSVEKETRTRM